jgi:hypothetical protein
MESLVSSGGFAMLVVIFHDRSSRTPKFLQDNMPQVHEEQRKMLGCTTHNFHSQKYLVL